MKLTVVNFGNDDFSLQQKWNSLSAKYLGNADEVISYTPNDIKEYLDKYPQFKKYKKGFGNYFWKPYVILKALENVKENDFLFYSDSGSFVLKDLKKLAIHLNNVQKDILAFKIPMIAKQWTKRDTFIILNSDEVLFTNTSQILAGFLLVKKTENAISFLEKFKDFCQDERIVTDLDNVLGKKNYTEFIAHRHDQSVLSVLSKKSAIVQIEGDLSDYGFFPRQYIKGKTWLYDDFCQDLKNYKFKNFVISNRKAHPIPYLLKFAIKRFLFAINLYKRC